MEDACSLRAVRFQLLIACYAAAWILMVYTDLHYYVSN